MVRVCFMIGLLAQALLAQSTTVLQGDWAKAGITVVPYDSPGFKIQASDLAAQSPASSILPYSFVLKNTSAHTIVAYSATWLLTDADGRVNTRNQVWLSLQTSTDGDAIPPSTDRLVTPLPPPPPSASARSITNFNRAVDSVRRTFAKQRTIVVSLEAAILDNGLALGSDALNTIPRISSRIDSEREVNAGVIAASRQGQAAVIEYLRGLVDEPVGDVIAASKEKTPELAYATFFTIQRADLARSYLHMAREHPEVVISRAEARMKAPRFVIHR